MEVSSFEGFRLASFHCKHIHNIYSTILVFIGIGQKCLSNWLSSQPMDGQCGHAVLGGYRTGDGKLGHHSLKAYFPHICIGGGQIF